MKLRSKAIIGLLAGLLLIGSLVSYISLGADWSETPTVLALPKTLAVSIDPQGPEMLAKNQTQVFRAIVNVDTALTHAWSVEYTSPTVFSQNGTEYLLVSEGGEATFRFLGEAIDTCFLRVLVNCSLLEGSARVAVHYARNQPVEVIDQQSEDRKNKEETQSESTVSTEQTPNQTLTDTHTEIPIIINPDYIINKTGEGLTQAINCTNGNIDFSSPDAGIVLQQVLAFLNITVQVCEGHYDINRSLTLKSDQHIVGYGAVINVIPPSKAVGNGEPVFGSNKPPINNTTIEGFTIQLNADKHFNQGIYLNNPYNCTIQQNKIYNAYNRGISLDGWASPYGGCGNKVIDNYVERTYSNFLGETMVIGNQNDSLVRGNVVVGSQQGGITLSGCFRVIVSNNTVLNPDGQGVGYGGVDLEASSNNTITDNMINGKGNGIRVSRGSYSNVFDGNVISQVACGIKLIDTLGPASYNNFSNNNITNTGTAIMIHSNTCVGNSFTNNNIATTSHNGIEDYGSYNSYRGGSIENFKGDRGIWIAGGVYEIVSGVQINAQGSSNTAGIFLDSVKYCIVKECTISGVAMGVIEGSLADLNQVNGCTITASIAPLTLIGANSVQSGNILATGK